jgi:hypothetical protein
MSKVINPNVDDHFITKGISFKCESDKETTDENAAPYNFDIKSIDMIYNPNYHKLANVYILPVFFKSPRLGEPSFVESGYLDNGRHIVPIKTQITGEEGEE